MFNDKKGQAALEFLMTYGWAILAAVIVIGALAYFGVFSPGRYAPDTCLLSAPLGCDEHNIQEAGNGTINMVIRNGAGQSIEVMGIEVEDCDNTGNLGDLGDGDTTQVSISGCGLSEGDRFDGDVTITYQTGELNQTSTGQVSGTVA